jgi:predicted Zn-dependent peptidase
MYRNTPEFPTIQALKDILSQTDGRALYRHYEELLRMATVHIFYIGTSSLERVANSLSHAFADYPVGSHLPVMPLCPATPLPFWSQTERMPVSQGKLVMGFRSGLSITATPDYHRGLLLNEIFGGSAASKLFLNVREKMSLCYYCSSSYSIYTGDMMVSSGIEVKNRQRVEEAILAQFEDIRKGHITKVEFEAAKRSLENCYRQIYDNPLDLSSFYGSRSFLGLSETVEECREAIAKVSLQDIVALSQHVVCDTAFFIEGTSEPKEVEDDEA